MRKFNLKGIVVQRMKGIVRDEEAGKAEAPAAAGENKESAEKVFSEKQGCLKLAWRTDVGRLRKNNQDAVILGNGLAGVADGMGGHKAGEIASAGLRDGLLREIAEQEPDPEKLAEAVKKVNRELWEEQETDANLHGMGTTLTVLWPTEKDMIVGQIGDSRTYLLRGGEMTQVTEDHSMVADMVRKGVLTEEQAACHPMRNYITRAVGTEQEIEIDMQRLDRKQGDRWLVCSDGLYGMIPKSELVRMLSIEDPEEAADRLLQAALDNGGKDNISLVILQDETAFETAEAEEAETEEKPETPEDEGKTEEEADAAAAAGTDEAEEVTAQ